MFLNHNLQRWKDLSRQEQGELLLAKHEGRTIEQWSFSSCGLPGSWWSRRNPNFNDEDSIFRIRPDPIITRAKLVWANQGFMFDHEFELSFNLIDGEPDCSSVTMRPL